MNIGVSTFSHVPSFGQWENSSVQTSYRGVSIVSGQRSGTKEISDEVPTCRNLTESFEDAEDLKVVSQLVSLSKVVDQGALEAEVAAAVVAEPWPGTSIVHIADVVVMTLNQAYKYLHMEDLLLALPGRVGKRNGATEVVFFNEKGK